MDLGSSSVHCAVRVEVVVVVIVKVREQAESSALRSHRNDSPRAAT